MNPRVKSNQGNLLKPKMPGGESEVGRDLMVSFGFLFNCILFRRKGERMSLTISTDNTGAIQEGTKEASRRCQV